MVCVIRPMRLADVPQVAQIERESFPSPWSATNFRNELLFNRSAQYIVACVALHRSSEAEVTRGSWLDELVGLAGRLLRRGKTSDNMLILGYAGLWVMADEAHLTNIAVRASHRGQGIGELLLLSTIELSVEKNAQVITLEVRPSSTAARALYSKYGFTEVGVRHGYYYDTKEDALLMTTDQITSASFQSRFQNLKQAHALRWSQEEP